MARGIGRWLGLLAALFPMGLLSAQPPGAEEVWWAAIDSLRPGVTVLAVDSLYGFEADSRRTIALSIRAFGPVSDGEDWSGLHKARWRYRYDWERNDIGECKPANVTVLIRSVITMPHLLNAASIQADLRREWVEYIAALRLHEEGHREITRQQLQRMREELLAIPFRPCSDHPEAIQAITDRHQAEVRRQQKAYDAETEHGRTQGANWPPREGG